MAGKRGVPRPSGAELLILQVLWDRGPSTVRQVWDGLEHGDRIGYTTVLKQLQSLKEKGLVACDDRARSHIYQATVTEEATQRTAARELITKLFRGSARKLMLQVLTHEKPSREELLEIRRLIDDMVRKK